MCLIFPQIFLKIENLKLLTSENVHMMYMYFSEWLMYDDLPFSLRTDAHVDLLRLWEKMTAPEVVTVNTGHCSDTRLKGKFSRQCTDEEVHKFMRHIETNVYGTKLVSYCLSNIV